ncbi:TATA-binding protein associated factor Taf2 [Rickenella mellea]|uniref:Transcription initiation factor TFIID subunit 2 n=1 Tax=Rickenella mellea TaxID=50990 RepID=A0A4Y7QFK0_9AGAM|nr:TATA-binding protein associated factor Taf2 [Rickenella mellea]
MQRDHARRGFNISHQKVVLDIDFAGSFRGYTEITIIPTSKDLRTICLNSRQCQIHAVTVGTYKADFVYHDPLAAIPTSDFNDCHRHPELKRKLYSALAECDEGELAIAIPRQVSVRTSGYVSNGVIESEVATPEPQTPGAPLGTVTEFTPIVLNIEYSLRNPIDGFQFVLPTDAYPQRVPHCYTTPSSPDAARCWVPCLDGLWEKCTWEFEFVVPRYLEEQDQDSMDIDGDDGGVEEGKHPTIVVCSGELVEQVAHPFNSSKTIFLFSQAVATSVQHVAFAAGPFHVYPIPTEVAGLTDDTTGAQTLMHAFCLPGHETELSTSVSFIRSAMNFYSTEFGSYPFGSHKLVFVDELPLQRFDSATLSIVTVDLLHGDDAVDQVFETRHALSHALACQWMGINIIQKTWSDTWIVNGLGLYIAGLFIRKLMGNNEYRFRMKKDMERVLDRDRGSMPPICQPTSLEPPDASFLPFINLKAPIVLHILDRRLGKSGTSLGLSRVLPKVFLSAISGEMPNNALSTHSFLRTCRKVSGVDLRAFVDQWIYGSGCPQFSFSATFNRKKMAVEIQMRQECPAFVVHNGYPAAMSLYKPVQFFEGQMTVRIHEADGTPYEHVLDILTPTKRFEVPFNTKYKRVRRNTKRYLARQAAAQAAADGDTEAAEAIGMIDMGFGLEVWEEEEERERWKVADWTEEEEQQMAGATYEWIRMDADFEWIARIQFDQFDYMWVSQLQRDRDVVAQLEAVHALAKTPNALVSSQLTRTVLVTNYFYRIRCEAALALVNCANQRLDYIGLFHLFKLFLRYCYDPEDPDQDLFLHKYVPRPNNFSDFSEYYVRKALLNAISQVRFENGKTPTVIRQFFIDQLRYNDNTTNRFSDAYYICAVIAALACASVSTAPPERGELLKLEPKQELNADDDALLKAAISEVERYRSMDRLIPSSHNVVTIAALEFHLVINMANLVPSDMKLFLTSTREGNATQVRLAGFDGLFLMKWYTPMIMRYIFKVMTADSSRVVRRHVARNVCESLSLLAMISEIKHAPKDAESLLIEEDGSTMDKANEVKRSEVDLVIRSLRKDKEVGKSAELRECILSAILDPRTDLEVRWCLLKLADLVVRGDKEPLPKVTIHLPPTPVVETPPPLPLPSPTVRMMAKPKIKIGNGRKSSLLSPASPLTVSGKIRTPLSNATPVQPLASTSAESTPKVPRIPLIATPKSMPGSKKKDKPVPKAQSSGMSANDLKACRSALKKLMDYKSSLIFRQPVDPVRDKAPNYFEIIKNPIDLSTMGAKLSEGLYKDRKAFELDFRLMIDNCQTYNPIGTYAHNESIALETFFDKQWVRINKTLEAADRAAAKQQENSMMPPPPPPEPVVPTATDAPTVPAARSTIKLKLGAAPSSAQETSKPSPKQKPPKPRKQKTTEPPPPPYEDDGSADLLQEVIAMEREMDESKQRTSSPLKQHFVDEDIDEDEEILNLVEPSPIERTRSPEPERVPAPVPPPVQLKIAAPKAKKPVEPVSRASPSVKGKEKEVAPTPPPAPTPAHSKSKTPPKTPATATPINEKKCKDVLKNLLKLPQAVIFSRPVDAELDGCPTYYDEIKDPMDFGSMKLRLDSHHYKTMEEFASNAYLVFSNCRKFNYPGTDPVLCADIVEKAFKKEWAKVMEKKLSHNDKRSLLGIMTKLQNELQFWVFREPVDPVLLGIPTYFDVIPKKDARDLRTIRGKLESDKFDSPEAWIADIELMVQNAVTFNGAQSEVGALALQLEQRAKELLAAVKAKDAKDAKDASQQAAGSQGKKRAVPPSSSNDGGSVSGAAPAGTKKVKLG